jgi:hypothetical protein
MIKNDGTTPVGFSWTEHASPIFLQALPESQPSAGDGSPHVSNAQAQPISVLIVWIPSLCLETLENANRAPPAITVKRKSKAKSAKEFVHQDSSLTMVFACLEDAPMDSRTMDLEAVSVHQSPTADAKCRNLRTTMHALKDVPTALSPTLTAEHVILVPQDAKFV